MIKSVKQFWRNVRVRAIAGLCGLANLMILGCCKTDPTIHPPPGDKDPLGFSQDIKGIISKFCFECHGDKVHEADLDLRTLDSILSGGESGPAIVPGHPEQSILLDMVHDEHMPPEGEVLTASDIERVREWIASGARP